MCFPHHLQMFINQLLRSFYACLHFFVAFLIELFYLASLFVDQISEVEELFLKTVIGGHLLSFYDLVYKLLVAELQGTILGLCLLQAHQDLLVTVVKLSKIEDIVKIAQFLNPCQYLLMLFHSNLGNAFR